MQLSLTLDEQAQRAWITGAPNAALMRDVADAHLSSEAAAEECATLKLVLTRAARRLHKLGQSAIAEVLEDAARDAEPFIAGGERFIDRRLRG